MTPAQLQQRLITYAGSLKQPSDFSQSRFSSAFTVTLTAYEPGVAGGYAKGQPLTDGYMFHASVSSLHSPSSFATHEVAFYQPGKKMFTEYPKAPCFWEASLAGEQLEIQGYERGAERPFQRGRLQEYWRPIANSERVFVVELLTYAPDNPTAQTCVYAVRYSGGDQ